MIRAWEEEGEENVKEGHIHSKHSNNVNKKIKHGHRALEYFRFQSTMHRVTLFKKI